MKKTLILLLLFIAATAFKTADDKAVARKVVEYCKNNIGKKVDRGECWDLAKFALDYAGADWTAPHDFGTKVDFKKDALKAGDILQMENVSFSWTEGDYTYSATFPHHTAVVYEVKDNGKIVLAHQNFNNVRKVATLEISLSDITSGTVEAYRPRAKS